MALKIRLRRMGRKNAPTYRIVVAESSMPRDGRIVASIGHYNPRTEPLTLSVDRAKALHWLEQGATPTETARALLKRAGVYRPEESGLGAAASAAVEGAKAAAAKVGGAVRGAASKVAGTARGAAAAVTDTAGEVVEEVRESAAEVVEAVKERVAGADEGAVEATASAGEPGADAGEGAGEAPKA